MCIARAPQVQAAPAAPTSTTVTVREEQPRIESAPSTPQMIPLGTPAQTGVTLPPSTVIFVPIPQTEPTRTMEASPTPIEQPKAIEIIAARGSRDLNREFVAISPENLVHIQNNEPGNWISDDNFINTGIVFMDGQSEDISTDRARSRVVTVTATDSTQNKVINGTGTMSTTLYRKQGPALSGYYYPFTYEFRTPGVHTITFTTEGLSKTIEFTAR